MPKYVIHIGPHKVASTYLQTSLSGLRRQLAERGILYPEAIMGLPTPSHHAALDAILRAGPNPALEQAFAAMNASGHKVIVLSWEAGCTLPGPAIAYLHRLIGPNNPVELVYFCRRFAERIPSLWKQGVRNGRSTTLPEAVANALRAPMLVAGQNASMQWQRWSKVFGRESLHLVPFNNLRDHNIDVFDHFAATFLAWPKPERPENPTLHASPDAIDTEIVRALNAIDVARPDKGSGNIFITFQKRKSQLDLGVLVPALERDAATLKIDDSAGAFVEVYKSLLSFKDRLISPEYGTDFFPRGEMEVGYIRQDYLMQQAVVPALHALYHQVRAALADRTTPTEAAADDDLPPGIPAHRTPTPGTPARKPAGGGGGSGGGGGGGSKAAAHGTGGPNAAGQRPTGAKAPGPHAPGQKAPGPKAGGGGGPKLQSAGMAGKPKQPVTA